MLGGTGFGVAAAGERIHTLEKLSSVISGYCRARRWDENGFVPDRRLAELGIR